MSLNKRQQSGFSMIEVLVSLLVIGVGLLGMSGLQIASMKGTTNAHSRTTASMLAFEMAERMRANKSGVEGGFYDNNVNCTKKENQCRASVCSPEKIARLDTQEVMCGVLKNGIREGGVVNLLPGGGLQVSCVGGCNQTNAVHDITISWGELNVHKDQADVVTTQSLAIAVTP